MNVSKQKQQAIRASQELRMKLLDQLYSKRGDASKQFVWRRDLEQAAGTDVLVELDYLIGLGHVKQDGPKYAITAAGIQFFEAWALGDNG